MIPLSQPRTCSGLPQALDAKAGRERDNSTLWKLGTCGCMHEGTYARYRRWSIPATAFFFSFSWSPSSFRVFFFLTGAGIIMCLIRTSIKRAEGLHNWPYWRWWNEIPQPQWLAEERSNSKYAADWAVKLSMIIMRGKQQWSWNSRTAPPQAGDKRHVWWRSSWGAGNQHSVFRPYAEMKSEYSTELPNTRHGAQIWWVDQPLKTHV